METPCMAAMLATRPQQRHDAKITILSELDFLGFPRLLWEREQSFVVAPHKAAPCLGRVGLALWRGLQQGKDNGARYRARVLRTAIDQIG
jgi:hypothetical protein